MKKPTKKQVIGAAVTAASFIPAVRVGRIALGVGKVAARTTVGKAAVKKVVGSKAGTIAKKELTRHAAMLRKFGNDRAADIGRTASNKYGRAADAALRLAKKYK
jgi:hypothetical protein